MPTYDSKITNLSEFGNDKDDKDLGIYIVPYLKFSDHILRQTTKANKIMGIIRRSYCHLDKISFKYLFCALVRPVLDYFVAIWYPSLQKDHTMM